MVRLQTGILIVGIACFTQISSAQTTSAPTQPVGEMEPEANIVVEPPHPLLPAREEVKILRAERKLKMPYLDKRYVKETINRKTVEAKQLFLQREEQGLEGVIDRAMNVSTPVKAARERIKLARRKLLVAAREFLPKADFNFELRKGSLSRDAFSGQDYHLSFKLPVFRGGILWNTFLSEKAQYGAAKKEHESLMNELVDDVSKSYFEFNRARQVYEDKKGLAERATRQREISKQKFEQALISEIEYLNVESMSGQFQYDVETAEQEFELAKLELQRYLNLDVADKIDISALYDVDKLIQEAHPKAEKGPAQKEPLVLSQPLETFIELAYRNRPDLQAEAQKLRSSRLKELVARGSFLPRADLTLEFGELGEAFISAADDPTHHPEWHLGIEVTQNLFGNRVKYAFDNDENAPSVSQFLQGTGSQITKRRMEVGILDSLQDYVSLQEAQVEKLEKVIELEKKEREMIQEVKGAYFDYHKARIQVESSLKRNQFRHKLAELAKIRLGKAEIEISEYLQAELDLSEERKKLHGALSDLFKAKSKLNRAVGIRDYLRVEEAYGV